MTFLADLYAAARSPSGRALWDAHIIDMPMGIPLRHPDRAYYLGGVVTDVPGLETAAGFTVQAASDDEILRFVVGCEAVPTLSDRRWYSEALRNMVHRDGDFEECVDDDGTQGYSDEVAGLAAQLMTQDEVVDLYDGIESRLGSVLQIEVFRVLTGRDDDPLLWSAEEVPIQWFSPTSLWAKHVLRVFRYSTTGYYDWLSEGAVRSVTAAAGAARG